MDSLLLVLSLVLKYLGMFVIIGGLIFYLFVKKKAKSMKREGVTDESEWEKLRRFRNLFIPIYFIGLILIYAGSRLV